MAQLARNYQHWCNACKVDCLACGCWESISAKTHSTRFVEFWRATRLSMSWFQRILYLADSSIGMHVAKYGLGLGSYIACFWHQDHPCHDQTASYWSMCWWCGSSSNLQSNQDHLGSTPDWICILWGHCGMIETFKQTNVLQAHDVVTQQMIKDVLQAMKLLSIRRERVAKSYRSSRYR